MQFDLVNNKEMLIVLCIWLHDGAVCLAVSGLIYICAQAQLGHTASAWGLFGTMYGGALWGLFFFFKRLFFSGSAFLIFCFPPTTPFFPSFSLSTVITV